jgi:hypothetical protein
VFLEVEVVLELDWEVVLDWLLELWVPLESFLLEFPALKEVLDPTWVSSSCIQ